MSSSPQIIPLTTDPNQTFELPVNIDNTVKSMFCNLRYNEQADYWVLTIKDAQGNLVLAGVPFITGNIPAGNILGQFAYLALGSAFILNTSNVATPDFPNNSDLGSDFILLWDNTPAQ